MVETNMPGRFQGMTSIMIDSEHVFQSISTLASSPCIVIVDYIGGLPALYTPSLASSGKTHPKTICLTASIYGIVYGHGHSYL